MRFLTPGTLQLIELALEEDLGRGDVTSSTIFDEAATAEGRIMAKESLVVSGLDLGREVFRRIDPRLRFEPTVSDGARVERGDTVVVVGGPTRALLGAERTALNFLQRLSGVATLTRRYVELCAGTRARVCDTRKTTPGWRAIDKQAVLDGGGANHRADLAAGVLIKDNHIAACGSVRAAVDRARARAPHTLRIEVEVTSLDQIEEAIAARAEVILLDNMSPAMVSAGVQQIAQRVLVEISGNVNLDTVRAYAEAGPDLISVGALTHSARAVDLSLEV